MIRLTSTYALRGDITRTKGNDTGGLFDIDEYYAGRVFEGHRLVCGVTKVQNNYINNTGDITINF